MPPFPLVIPPLPCLDLSRVGSNLNLSLISTRYEGMRVHENTERRTRVFFSKRRSAGKTRKTCSHPLPLSTLPLSPTRFSAFDGDRSLRLTPEIAAATLRSATKTLHGSSGGAALPFVLLSVDSEASTATVRVSRRRKGGASGGSYSNSVDPVAALVASLACVTRSPQLLVVSSADSAAAAGVGAEKTLPPQPLALTVVRRCSSVASLASDPRSFDPCAEIDESA